ncbi:MAG: penicillin-binding protein 2 [Corynebacteriales bacterium]|nr:penicillin-binding protein 2 [Mycobacteriales bacterium]
MNAPLRRVAIAIFVLFGLLFANLNYVQYIRGDELRNDPRNRRVALSEYSTQRGAIVVDGAAVASVEKTKGPLKYLRTYPAGELYAHTTGYKSPIYGESSVESAEESMLNGTDDRLFVRRVSDMLTGRKAKGANVVLTLEPDVQKAAFDALAGQKGAVVALDPRTGAVLASVSGPTYDPNPLASHDEDVAEKAWRDYNNDPNKPMLNRALNETYPPGSTFKVVMTAAALKEGYTADTQVPSPLQYTPEQTTKHIQNYNGRSCGGSEVSLKQALTVSCNTSYAMLANELGADKVRDQAREFGFEDKELRCPTRVSESKLGPMSDPPALAQSGIGQRDVRMTPLQGAMIASAAANDGELKKPYLVSEIQAPDVSIISKTRVETMSEPMSSSQAKELREMMNSVVDNGTGTAAQIDGVEVGGKTGTAEDGDARQDHEWFIGYAIVDGTPVAAVAVVLENAGTSSAEAADIAGTVMESIVAQRGN